MKNARTSLWLSRLVLVAAAGAAWSNARAYGDPNDGNCAFDPDHLRCAFVVAVGTRFANPFGTTLAPNPGGPGFINFTNLGIVDNAGYIWNAGFFDNFGFYNEKGATFNNLAKGINLSVLEVSHGLNLGTITNDGIFRLNFIQGNSIPFPGAGLNNGVGGILENKRSLVNRGELFNAGLVTNFSNASMVSSYNPGTDPMHPNLYDVAINNVAGATFLNYGFLRNGFSSITPPNSAITNSGTFMNLAGGAGFNDGQLENIDTIKNTGSGTITNSGTLINSGKIENNGAISNSGNVNVSAVGKVTGSGTFASSDTAPDQAPAPVPSTAPAPAA